MSNPKTNVNSAISVHSEFPAPAAPSFCEAGHPRELLSGCGVPEDFITYQPSLIGTMQPIQYQSCFISDSSQDDEFARRLHERMRAEKLRVWSAPEDMQGVRNSSSQSTGPSRSTIACCWCSRSTA